jgi:hypothetical protein
MSRKIVCWDSEMPVAWRWGDYFQGISGHFLLPINSSDTFGLEFRPKKQYSPVFHLQQLCASSSKIYKSRFMNSD